MTADQGAIKPPLGRRDEVNIHSKYLVVARYVPPHMAADIVSGRTLSARLTHGYRRETLGLRRFTNIETPGGGVVYEMREPGQGLLPGFDNPPTGVSADVEYKVRIDEAEFNTAWGGTVGHRVGKDRHTVELEITPGWPNYSATMEVFRAGVEGEVDGMQHVKGHMILVVHFPNLAVAGAFNERTFPKPDWFGYQATKPFSTKKLYRQLSGENESIPKDRQLNAVEWLQHSANLDNLRERAQLA